MGIPEKAGGDEDGPMMAVLGNSEDGQSEYSGDSDQASDDQEMFEKDSESDY